MSAMLKLGSLRACCAQRMQRCLQHTLQDNKPAESYHAGKETVPVFRNAAQFPERTAVKDKFGSYTYGNLFMSANELSKDISKKLDGRTNERIMFLCPNNVSYVITQWAIWISGQIAVPVHHNQPESILSYYLNDCDAELLVTTPEHAEKMHSVAAKSNKKLLVLDDRLRHNALQRVPQLAQDLEGGQPDSFYDSSDAMILYTSGTTGNPKGVVMGHKNLQAQVSTLIDAWKWSPNDIILHALPLNHTHGIVNALLCPLALGAKCTMLPKFDTNAVWANLLAINTATSERISVFMGVPTMYAKLVHEYDNLFAKNPKVVEYIKTTLKNKFRLMVSGSAPLPAPLFQRWEQITGHRLLERYGMTETGMCLSSEYGAEREPGSVGVPLPGVSVRLAALDPPDQRGQTILECSSGADGRLQLDHRPWADVRDLSGEVHVKSPALFREYFRKPDETRAQFTADGWFRTGDVAAFDINKKRFRMMGRTSVDILKTGGYKVSALEVETHLLGHPDVLDCAVVGVDDDTWGQRVAAVIVLRDDSQLQLEQLRAWAKTKLPEYAVPSVVRIFDRIPKNTMGKVNKPDLVRLLAASKP